jgi:hypothetical protein
MVVSGIPAAVDAEGGFSAQISLQEGANTITVAATDAAGNVNTVQINVSYSPGSATAANPGLRSGSTGGSGGGSSGGSSGGGGSTGGTTNTPQPGTGSTGGGGGGTAPADSDGDGIIDSSDRCANESGISAHGGCPAPVLTVYGEGYVCPYQTFSYEVGWTGSLTPSSYRWYRDDGATFTGGKTVDGLYFEPGDNYFTVDVVFDGVKYSKRTYVQVADSC